MRGVRYMLGAALLLLAVNLHAVAAAVPEPGIVSTPTPDKATVVFMRPSGIGIADYAPLFDATGETPVILGRLAAHYKLAYAVAPGRHRFMVIGNNATLLDADLAGGKVYYVLITPEQGSGRPHFVFTPITANTTPIDFAGYHALTEWTVIDQDAIEWADRHIGSIKSKEARALRDWKGTPKLNAGDTR